MKNLTILFFEERCKALQLWTRKVVGCWRKSLIRCPNRNLGDSSAESCADWQAPLQEISEKKCVVVSNTRTIKPFKPIAQKVGPQDLVLALLFFSSALIYHFLTIAPFFPFGLVMNMLCSCMLEVCDLLFDFSVDCNKEITLSLRRSWYFISELEKWIIHHLHLTRGRNVSCIPVSLHQQLQFISSTTSILTYQFLTYKKPTHNYLNISKP